MDENHQLRDRSALIAYGSETGNANDYAEELGRVLERIRFGTHVSELDAIDSASALSSGTQVSQANACPVVIEQVFYCNYNHIHHWPG